MASRPGKEVLEFIEARGPWPFVTRRVYRDAQNVERIWESRRHRKGLHQPTAGGGISPPSDLRKLNKWIGGIFAIGSSLFALGCILLLAPGLAAWTTITNNGINLIFFLGSIPFTTAAYLQLYQSANAPGLDGTVAQRSFFGWHPRDIGWLASALQFAGTLLFNLNTFDAMKTSLSWFQQDLQIWVPDFFGSIFFLASGYLCFIETCHAHGAWKPTSLSWWITVINLLGCIGFMIAAFFCFVLPGPAHPEWMTIFTAFTLQGAICFLIGSLLMFPEAADSE
ncbi:hypothetical protein [Haloferula sp.]|uniref:hypothetical protein n=1 Tax=Haloferula sp. TaxID=2497595 RepID=UPI003C70A235